MHTDSSGGIAADRREQQQMRKKAVKNAGMIRIYLNMAWKLLQKNLLSIVIFETVYRLFSSQLVSSLANAAINFSLKQLGTSYMTSENFNKIMLHPLTLLLIFGILLVFFFCMLFEIYAVMAALEASWERKRIWLFTLKKEELHSLCVPARGPGFSTWQRASRTFGCTAATAPSAV